MAKRKFKVGDSVIVKKGSNKNTIGVIKYIKKGTYWNPRAIYVVGKRSYFSYELIHTGKSVETPEQYKNLFVT